MGLTLDPTVGACVLQTIEVGQDRQLEGLGTLNNYDSCFLITVGSHKNYNLQD